MKQIIFLLFISSLLCCCTKQITKPETTQVTTQTQADQGASLRPITYNVVCTGNSLVYGYKLIDPRTESYPAQLSINFPFDANGSVVYNKGINGNTTLQMLQPVQIDSVYAKFIAGDKNLCFAWEIGNDIYFNGVSAAVAVTNFNQYADSIRAHGFKFYGLTLPYRNNYYMTGSLTTPGGDDTTSYSLKIAEVNSLLRINHTHFDGLLDIAAEPRFQHYDSVYYMADRTHLTTEGYGRVVEIILQHKF